MFLYFIAAIDNPLPYVKVRPTDGNTSYNGTKSGDYVIPTGHSFTIECHGAYPPRLRVLRRNKKNVSILHINI